MSFSIVKYLGITGSAGLIIGSMLPWATIPLIFGTIIKNGIEGDGIFTAIMGLVSLLVLLRKRAEYGKRFSLISAFFGVLSLVILAVNWPSLSNTSSPIIGQVGIGAYLTGISALLLLVAGFSKPVDEEAKKML
ncbi:MAG: hypothetical protein WD740_03325 [Anaerolineales bacterium]